MVLVCGGLGRRTALLCHRHRVCYADFHEAVNSKTKKVSVNPHAEYTLFIIDEEGEEVYEVFLNYSMNIRI